MLVSLVAAVSEDGLIAPMNENRSTSWTSQEDTQYYVSQLKQADTLIMGHKTFATIARFPKGSNWCVYTAKPQQFVNPKPAVINAIGCDLSPSTMINQLKNQGSQQVLVCGGASIYTQFVAAGLVDRMLLTVEPVRFGRGIGLFSSSIANQFHLIKTIKLSEQSIVYEYEANKKGQR